MGFPIFGSTGTTYINREKVFDGVTLYTTFGAERVNLINLEGNVIHTSSPPTNPTYMQIFGGSITILLNSSSVKILQ